MFRTDILEKRVLVDEVSKKFDLQACKQTWADIVISESVLCFCFYCTLALMLCITHHFCNLDLNQLPPSTTSATEKKWIIDVPYGTSKIEQTVACLTSLRSLQKSRPINSSEEHEFFYKKGLIGVAVKEYARRLVRGVIRAFHTRGDERGDFIPIGQEVSTSALATSYYSVVEHIRCLLNTWRQPIESRATS